MCYGIFKIIVSVKVDENDFMIIKIEDDGCGYFEVMLIKSYEEFCDFELS